MTHPEFPTIWHLLVRDVLFAVEESTGSLLLGEDQGTLLWVCWTDQEAAGRMTPPGYRLVHGLFRRMVTQVPAGVAVVVDPQDQGYLRVEPDAVDQLRGQAVPFPAGVPLTFETEVTVPDEVASALRAAAEGYSFVTGLWLLRYRIEEGPWVGVIAYEASGGPEGDESVVAAVAAALDATLGRPPEGLAGIEIVAVADLPPRSQERIASLPPLMRKTP